ncbi:MAG: cytochrome c, partial [Proteobacteria bacterium]|nr:cytochrome c [Pseudomonadota bacterium]
REKTAGAFWSLVVSLDMIQAKCLGPAVSGPELKHWLHESNTRFLTVRQRLPVTSHVDAQFQDVMNSYSQFPLDAERFLKMEQLKSSLFDQLAEVPKPSSTPIFEVGRQTFVAHCASCHGFKGEGDGPLSSRLRFKPISFVLPGRYSTLSPISVYAAM